jgi:aminoglycoside/choline kinase family phosphotransferase
MTDTHRPLEIAAFLDQHNWGEASAQAFDGDFSPRRYARLTAIDGSTAILMDADADQKTPQFVAFAKLLRKNSIAAPEIIAAEADGGLVLMQDFGSRNLGALLDNGAAAQPYFLRAATLLASLHKSFDRADSLTLDLPLFNADLFILQAELYLDAYVPFTKQREASEDERQDFRAAWRAVLRPIEIMPKSLILRDFMPDNLMDLPDGRLGVLDFQDAGIGPVAYDLASLCEEVRRDGGFSVLSEVVAQYRATLADSGGTCALTQADLMRACTILSAQRHTRILGIITQITMKTGRRDKLAFLPRIHQHLQRVLAEPYLFPVREWMDNLESTGP